MPRLPHSLFRKAYSIHPHLCTLLRTCRDIESASRELRWLRQHVNSQHDNHNKSTKETLLRKLCRERGRGKPLQYVLGSEYFGDLELLCRPGVLIPRHETAISITYLSKRLIDSGKHKHPEPLRVLDLCTGSGCMALLFHHEYTRPRSGKPALHPPQILGIDISSRAKALAEVNLERICVSSFKTTMPNIHFALANLFGTDTVAGSPPGLLDVLKKRDQMNWDVIVSNPPYISPQSFFKDTARSVRGYEPRLALVPPNIGEEIVGDEERGDLFYPSILRVAKEVRVKILLVEVADLAQAGRAAGLAVAEGWDGVEIWRDEPENDVEDPLETVGVAEKIVTVHGREIPVKGCGHGRSVFCWRGEASRWIGSTKTP